MSTLMKRKSQKKGLHFTIMLCGQSGLGKSTFINTLVESQLIPVNPSKADSLDKTLTITPYSCEIEEDRVKMNLTIVDTPGLSLCFISVALTFAKASAITLTIAYSLTNF